MSDRTDPAWDEYMSTGEDPTGGELEGNDDTSPSYAGRGNRKPPGCNAFFAAVCICFFVACLIAPEYRKKKEEAEIRERQEWTEYQRRLRDEQQFRIDTAYDALMRRREIAEKELKRKEDSTRLARMAAYSEEMRKKNIAAPRTATYDDGYREGYECGHDDADCNEGYGYSEIDPELARYYTESYKRGFARGYRAGYGAGKEDYEYVNGI